MKKRLLSFLVLITIILVVVSFSFMGCKKEVAEETAAETAEETAVETAAETESAEEVTTEEIKKFEGTKITVVFMSGRYVDAARSVVDEFKEMTGIEVFIVDYPWASLHERLFAELIGQTGNFDMVPVAGQWLGEIAPFMEDLSPFMEESDLAGFESVTAYNYSGVQYAVPYQTNFEGVFYRTDLFEKAGIVANPNWTWDEYIDIAKKLTADGIYGTGLAGVKHQQNLHFINRYWALGGKTTTPDWEVTMDNPITIAALELLEETYNYSSPKVVGAELADVINLFLSGEELAMLEVWPGEVFRQIDDPEKSKVVGNWSILPLPGNANTYGSFWGIGIGKDSKNKEATYEWIKFYTSKDNQRTFWHDFGIIPTRASIWEESDMLKPAAVNWALGKSKAKPNWQIEAAAEGWEGILNDEVAKFIAGDQTAEDTAKNLQNLWTDLLQRKPAPEGYLNPE